MNTLRAMLLGLISISVLVVGCGSDPADPNPPATETLGPHVGSSYHFNVYLLDAAGNQGGLANQGMFTVTSTDESYRGEDGITTLLHSEKSRLLYVKYLPTGDLLYYYSQFALPFYPPMGSAWVRFPFGGGSTGKVVLVDSTYLSEDGMSERFLVEREATSLGAENKTVKGDRMSTTKLEERITQTLFIEGVPETTQVIELVYWYAPEVKYFVQIDAYTYWGNPDDPPLWSASRDILVDYELK